MKWRVMYLEVLLVVVAVATTRAASSENISNNVDLLNMPKTIIKKLYEVSGTGYNGSSVDNNASLDPGPLIAALKGNTSICKPNASCKKIGGTCMSKKYCHSKIVDVKNGCSDKACICCIGDQSVRNTSKTLSRGVTNPFMIIHKLSRFHLCHCYDHGSHTNYVCIFSPNTNPNSWCHWTFESMDKEWGLIRNRVDSNLVFYPNFGDSSLFLKPFNNDEATPTFGYFAINQIDNKIIQRFGKIVQAQPHTDPQIPVPRSGSIATLTRNTKDAYAEFVFVNPSDQNQEVLPYGHPTIIGEWQLVFSLVKARATQSWEHEVKIGKSASQSISSGFEFGWEVSASAQAEFFAASVSVSASASLSKHIESSHSSTWNEEAIDKRTITVIEGQSVAVWQLVFTGQQLSHKAVHSSNIFHDTASPNTKPTNPMSNKG